MAILIGLAAAVAVLYVWLAGHWFGRVLAFLVLAVPLGAGGAMLFITTPAGADNPTGAVIGAILGVLAAWFVSSIPTYRSRDPY